MNDLAQNLWTASQPIVYMLIATIGTGLLAWGVNAIRVSAWYQRQPWVVKKAVDMALTLAVRKLQPEADRIKNVYGGKLPTYEAELLHQAAVQDAMETIKPSVAAALPARELQEKISERVVVAVSKEKKRRKANPNKPGGAGAHP